MARDDFEFDNYIPEKSGQANHRNPGRYSRDYSDSQTNLRSMDGGFDRRRSPQSEQMRARKMRKRKRARIKRAVLTVLLTILLVAAIGGIVYGVVHFVSTKKSGESDFAAGAAFAGNGTSYVREVDITQEIAGNIAFWLSDVEDVDVDVAWVKERCNDLQIKCNLVMVKDGFSKGTYEESISLDSYNELCVSVDACMDSIMNEIFAQRLVKAGYAESITSDEAAVIASSVLGTNASAYIKEKNVVFVPDIEKLNKEHGISKGSYLISKGKITWTTEDGNSITETMIKKNNSLAFAESNRVYLREGN